MENALENIDRIADRLSRVSVAMACFSLFVMLWMIVGNVLMRVIWNAPIAFVEEYSGFMYVFMIFLGLGWATRSDQHIYVSLVYDRLRSPRAKKGADVITTLLSLIVVGVYLLYGVDVLWDSVATHERSVVTYTPFWIPKVGMCLGLTVFFLEVLVRLLKIFTGFPTKDAAANATK